MFKFEIQEVMDLLRYGWKEIIMSYGEANYPDILPQEQSRNICPWQAKQMSKLMLTSITTP